MEGVNDEEALSPQEALRQRRANESLEQAQRAWDTARLTGVGQRCPRCGALEREGLPQDALPPCPRCGVERCSAEAGALLLAPKGKIAELFRGASYLPRGGMRLLRSPSLWKLAIIPTIINLAVLVFAFVLATQVVWPWLEGLTSEQALADWTGWGWGSLAKLLQGLTAIGGFLSLFILPLLSSWLLVAFPCGIIYKLLFMPFMELLTESTERIVLGFKDEAAFEAGRFFGNLAVAILDAVLLTFLQGCLFVLLLPLNFLPVVGSLLWALLPPAIFAGMDFSDINLVRRGYTTREKTLLWRQHFWRFFGFGLSFCFLITIPLLNALVIPAAAVGGAPSDSAARCGRGWSRSTSSECAAGSRTPGSSL